MANEMLTIVEYRDVDGSFEWKRSEQGWSLDDVNFFNRVCGYNKYRARVVN